MRAYELIGAIISPYSLMGMTILLSIGLISVPLFTLTCLALIFSLDYLYKANNRSYNKIFKDNLNEYTIKNLIKLNLLSNLSLRKDYSGIYDEKCELQSYNILLIAGNGAGSFGRGQVWRHIKALKAHGANSVTVIGDGASDLDMFDVIKVASMLKNDTRSLTVIIIGHGMPNKDFGHCISLKHGIGVPTYSLLSVIKNALGNKKELSFFLESCFGGMAVKYANSLGCSIASLAGENNIIFGLLHTDGFLYALESATKQNNGELSARKLLEIYLLQPNGFSLATLNLFSPMYASPNVTAINLKERLNSLEGEQISDEIEDLLHNKFDLVIGAEEVNRNVDSVRFGNSLYNKYLNGDIGKSLLFALIIHEQKLMRVHDMAVEHANFNQAVTPKF